MSKKIPFLTVLLLTVPLVLAACSGKKSSAPALPLPQTFKAADGATAQYPEGWVAREGKMGIEIGNASSVLDLIDSSQSDQMIPAGDAVVLLMPLESLDTINMAGRSAKDVMRALAQSMSSGNSKSGEVKDTKVGGKSAARFSYNTDTAQMEGFFIGYLVDDKTVMIAGLVVHQGEMSQFENTALAMIASYQAVPAAGATPTPAG